MRTIKTSVHLHFLYTEYFRKIYIILYSNILTNSRSNNLTFYIMCRKNDKYLNTFSFPVNDISLPEKPKIKKKNKDKKNKKKNKNKKNSILCWITNSVKMWNYLNTNWSSHLITKWDRHFWNNLCNTKISIFVYDRYPKEDATSLVNKMIFWPVNMAFLILILLLKYSRKNSSSLHLYVSKIPIFVVYERNLEKSAHNVHFLWEK